MINPEAYSIESPDSLAGRMGIKLLEMSPERVVGTMPVAGNTQPYGLLHGGATCATYEIEVADGTGARVATARLTCLIRPTASARAA